MQQHRDVTMSSKRGIMALSVASVSFGSASLFIRFAGELPAASLSFYRLSIAALVMVVFGWASGSLKRVEGSEVPLLIVSGMVLALHFLTYVFAVQKTTIANATFLVNTSPVMLAAFSPLVLKEKTTNREILGVCVAMFGVLLVSSVGNGFRSIGLGDLSALASAFLLAIYTMIGRRARVNGLTTGSYTSYVYSVAALVSCAIALGSGANVFQTRSFESAIAILGLALVPTAMGHSLYNYSLGTVKALTANLFPLMEPIIASSLAIPLFNEIPTPIQVVGYALILTSVILAVSAMLHTESLFA